MPGGQAAAPGLSMVWSLKYAPMNARRSILPNRLPQVGLDSMMMGAVRVAELSTRTVISKGKSGLDWVTLGRVGIWGEVDGPEAPLPENRLMLLRAYSFSEARKSATAGRESLSSVRRPNIDGRSLFLTQPHELFGLEGAALLGQREQVDAGGRDLEAEALRPRLPLQVLDPGLVVGPAVLLHLLALGHILVAGEELGHLFLQGPEQFLHRLVEPLSLARG